MSKSIKFEDVSKLYRLGSIGTGTLADDLSRLWAGMLGKPDPVKKVSWNVQSESEQSEQNRKKILWALKDISFDATEGEVLGIVGHNGAGKSTLLKLLSRVTAPTCGQIKVKGRLVSLLEVGTGFHPELSGRENIFLNGSLLGMRAFEIRKRIDQIIEFSGCERFIDTPIKRYSSGMTVRLGLLSPLI